MRFKQFLNEKEGECMKTVFDSKKDTCAHIQKVAEFINLICSELEERAKNHDSSKLEEPEKAYFDEYTPKLKDCVYGSDEYKTFLKELQVALKHHYEVNRHHPEHFKNGMRGMNLIDIVELLCDWYAASQRHKDGDIKKSIELNQSRFGYNDELKEILLNTVEFFEEK